MTRARPLTDYERMEADPKQRAALRKEELILAATNAIAEELERQQVTKMELARRLDTTRGNITQLLSGGRNLTLGTIAEMADALNCKVEMKLVPHARRMEAGAGQVRRTTRAARR